MSSSLRLVCCILLLGLLTCSPPLSKRHLFVIGDSNGARQGWVYHLQQLRGGGPLVNTSLSGNTIGFNYGGDLSKNTLENLTAYLRKGYAEMGEIDDILISLGTNDCKNEFADRHAEIETKLEDLLNGIDAFFADRGQEVPRVVLVTPPPLDGTKANENFASATPCVEAVAASYRTIAAARGLCIVDSHASPGKPVLEYSKDGVHFSAEGYALLAQAVVESCY